MSEEQDSDRVTVRCMDGTDLNYQTQPMSRKSAKTMIAGIEKHKTCTLEHTIHPVGE